MPPLLHTVDARDGRFASPPLPAGAYLVRAVAAEGAVADRLVSLLADERRELSLDLSPPHVLRGHAVHDDGTPYRGPVRLLRSAMPEPDAGIVHEFSSTVADARVLTTDAEGGFTAEGLSTGRWRVGLGDASLRLLVDVVVPEKRRLEIVVPRLADAVEYRVVARATGEPVAGAGIRWHAWGQGGEVAARRTSDVSGRFRVPDSAGSLSVEAPGFLTWPSSRSDESGETTLRLDAPATVHGRVTAAADGAPVAGVTVEASSSTAHGFGTATPDATAVTDAEGRYVLTGLLPGEISVRVRGPHGVARGLADLPQESAHDALNYDPLAVTVEAGGDGVMDVVLEPAARVVGRVTESKGAPASGVGVVAYVPGYSYPSSTLDPSYWTVARSTTDAEGRYAIAGLAAPGAFRVLAARGAIRAEGTARFERGRLEVTCDLALPATLSFDAHVVDAATGKGLVGVPVGAETRDPWSLWNGVSTEGGFVRVGPLLRADVQLKTEREAEWSGSVRVALPADGEPPPVSLSVSRMHAESPPTEFRFVPQPREAAASGRHSKATATTREEQADAPHVVTGRIVDPQGGGVRGLRVRVVRPGERERSLRDAPPPTRTDMNGRFRVAARGGEQEVLVVNVPESFAAVLPMEVPAGDVPMEIRLRASVEAHVRVVDGHGKGLTGWRVRAWSHVRSEFSNLDWDSRAAYGWTDAEGRALLTGLDPEAGYAFAVEFEPSEGPTKSRAIDPWTPADTTITVREARRVRGSVVDPAGRPLRDAHVIGYRGNERVGRVDTAIDGTFELVDEAADDFWIVATMVGWGDGLWSEPVPAPPEGTPVRLTLDPGAGLDIRLEGARVAKRALYVMSDTDVPWKESKDFQIGWCDAEGRATIRGLHPKRRYAIWVAPSTAGSVSMESGSDEATALLTNVEAADPPRTLPIRLEMGGRIVAQVPKGVSWESPASIHARHGPMDIEGQPLPDGTYEFRGLVDVPWTVRIEAWGGGHRYEAVGRVGETVTLAPASATKPK